MFPTPRNMRCLSCGHDPTKGKVFRNILKTISSEANLGAKTITLHCKCPDCATAIIIETDPKNKDYGIVKEAKHTVATRAPLKDVGDAEFVESGLAVFKGAKRRSPGSEPQEEWLGVEFSASRPAKKVKKDFARA
ncbi:hypothetical protein AG0111_0g8834 [Alternaria gaisen]|uniref:Uncharacterized protein n=1 Tax=Alternaria gaisen TaxID=167740 RepID=A0ACB6FEB6_9PLEO|nr:hypothetical protein AG0111_0g8834 [Alternaria gaisen]